jgi:hypothetical protein
LKTEAKGYAMQNDVELLNTRLLDLFTIDELAKVTMLEWKHEGREIEEDRFPFFSDEEIGLVRGGYDPGTLWNSIVNQEACGDVVVELYDPSGKQIYDANGRLKRELEAFEDEHEGYRP